MTHKYDFLVIGLGVAVMSFALKVAAHGKVAIITKNQLEDSNTFHAQEGIATVRQTLDSFDKFTRLTILTSNNNIKQTKE